MRLPPRPEANALAPALRDAHLLPNQIGALGDAVGFLRAHAILLVENYMRWSQPRGLFSGDSHAIAGSRFFHRRNVLEFYGSGRFRTGSRGRDCFEIFA